MPRVNSKLELPLAKVKMPNYWQHVEPHWSKVNIYGTARQFHIDYVKLRPPIRHLLTVAWLKSEVCNGGFHQFFGNPTGVLAPEARTGLIRIGNPVASRILASAMSFFGLRYPRSALVRERALAAYSNQHPKKWNPFEMHDNQFYALLGDDGLNDAIDKAMDEFVARSLRSRS